MEISQHLTQVAGSVDLAGPVTLGDNITIDTEASASNSGSITFASTATINGNKSLTMVSGTGAIALQGSDWWWYCLDRIKC